MRIWRRDNEEGEGEERGEDYKYRAVFLLVDIPSISEEGVLCEGREMCY